MTTLRQALEDAQDLYEIGYQRCFARWQGNKALAEKAKQERQDVFAKIDAALATAPEWKVIEAAKRYKAACDAMRTYTAFVDRALGQIEIDESQKALFAALAAVEDHL